MTNSVGLQGDTLFRHLSDITATLTPDITQPILGNTIMVECPGKGSIVGVVEEVSYSTDDEGYVICNMRVKAV